MTIEQAQKRIENAKAEIVAAEAELKRLKDVGRVVKPVHGITGHVIHGNGDVHPTDSINYANDAYAASNWAPTKQAAELITKRRRLTVKLKEKIAEFNDGWVPDWSDANQMRCCFSMCGKSLCIETRCENQIMESAMYFKKRQPNMFDFTNSELKLIITGEE